MDFKKHDELAEQGYLRRVVSPCGRLVLYNYTDKTTYEKFWNTITLNARGTVYELKTGNIVAKAFPKFFNFGELEPVVQKQILSETNFSVFEKMDGSLGILYFYEGQWRVNTRGSFTSDQAVRAQEILKKYDLSNVNPRFTLLVEIIYPENRIIVDYGDKEELVILSAISGDGIEATYSTLKGASQLTGMPLCPKHKFNSIEEVLEKRDILPSGEEGFVVRFRDGFRCKFKSIEYLRVAKIMSNMTPLTMWANMECGKVSEEFLEAIPEEFFNEVKEMVYDLENQYHLLLIDIHEKYKEVKEKLGLNEVTPENRKKLGVYLSDLDYRHKVVFFPIFLSNFKAVEAYIMKIIRPKGNVL